MLGPSEILMMKETAGTHFPFLHSADVGATEQSSLGSLKQTWTKKPWATLSCWPLSPSSAWSRMVSEAPHLGGKTRDFIC